MAKGILQIIVGIFVLAVSYFMNYKTADAKFSFFFIVGGLFLAYGIIKLVFYLIFIKEKKKKKKIKPIKFNEEKPSKKIRQYKKNDSPFHTHHETIIACHSCNTKHYNNANYCQMCGSKMK